MVSIENAISEGLSLDAAVFKALQTNPLNAAQIVAAALSFLADPNSFMAEKIVTVAILAHH